MRNINHAYHGATWVDGLRTKNQNVNLGRERDNLCLNRCCAITTRFSPINAKILYVMNTELAGTCIFKAKVEKVRISTNYFHRVEFAEVDFTKLVKWSFHDSKISCNEFVECDFKKCNFKNVDFTMNEFDNCEFRHESARNLRAFRLVR